MCVNNVSKYADFVLFCGKSNRNFLISIFFICLKIENNNESHEKSTIFEIDAENFQIHTIWQHCLKLPAKNKGTFSTYFLNKIHGLTELISSPTTL